MSDTKRKRMPWNPRLCNFPFSEKVNSISEGAECLYGRLLDQTDDNGNYWGDPAVVLGQLMPHRMASGQVSVSDIKARLAELSSQTVGLVVFYEVNGRKYLHLANPFKLLRKDVSPDIKFPTNGPNTELVRNDDGPATERGRDDDGPLEAKAKAKAKANPEAYKTAETAYGLVVKNHPSIASLKSKEQTIKEWAETAFKFSAKTGKSLDEIDRFLAWAAQDRCDVRPGSTWTGWWEQFHGMGILAKEKAWVRFALYRPPSPLVPEQCESLPDRLRRLGDIPHDA
jgi:hypothetical protein